MLDPVIRWYASDRHHRLDRLIGVMTIRNQVSAPLGVSVIFDQGASFVGESDFLV